MAFLRLHHRAPHLRSGLPVEKQKNPSRGQMVDSRLRQGRASEGLGSEFTAAGEGFCPRAPSVAQGCRPQKTRQKLANTSRGGIVFSVFPAIAGFCPRLWTTGGQAEPGCWPETPSFRRPQPCRKSSPDFSAGPFSWVQSGPNFRPNTLFAVDIIRYCDMMGVMSHEWVGG